ncbi:hypothetical protein Anapl_08579 [Anas platyrhynchos]|uniref:Uncharacterized protein n=1 Tax=Anas platyrhynchos TaxID=8839 RepID=R0LXP1_ANAPL|nr:hypothetical protein Anapl_08579 [Anas platyrhynchos]
MGAAVRAWLSARPLPQPAGLAASPSTARNGRPKCRTYSERKMSSTSLRQSVSGFACQTALPHTLQDCCCPPIYITALLHQMLEDKAWDPTGSPGADHRDYQSKQQQKDLIAHSLMSLPATCSQTPLTCMQAFTGQCLHGHTLKPASHPGPGHSTSVRTAVLAQQRSL